MEAGQVVDATVVEDEPGQTPPDAPPPDAPPPTSTALVTVPHGAGAIIRAEDPDEIIAKATQIANSLKALIDSQNLAKNLGGQRKHVEVGGWQAAGTMLGALGGEALHAEPVWSRIACLPNGEPIRRTYKVTERRRNGTSIEYEVDGYDWEARVEVRTAGGVVVGSAEAMCSRTESTWAQRPDPAVKSMAETRAESRAYRRAIGWIAHMAGYNPTPAEEMPQADEAPSYGPKVENGMRPLVFEAIKSLIELDQEPAAAAQLPELQEVAKAVAGTIATEAGYMPLITGKALLAVANAREARKGAALDRQGQDQAAEAPDAPRDDVAEARAAADAAEKEADQDFPAGKVWIRGEDGAPDDARTVSLSAAVRICRCKGGFDAAEKADARQAGIHDDQCPLRNHGIPF